MLLSGPSYPALHIAFALLNEGAGEGNTGNHSLFTSIIEKAGGDPVSWTHVSSISSCSDAFLPDDLQALRSEAHRAVTHAKPTTR